VSTRLCHHCQLPLLGPVQTREIYGKSHSFCCYGCCLAFQVRHGEREEPESVGLLIRLGVGAFLAMNIMLFSLLIYSGTFEFAEQGLLRAIHFLLWGLSTPLLFILGQPFIAGAWRAARGGRATADTLVSLGTLSAYGYSAQQTVSGGGAVYFDTVAMVLLLFTLGRYLEAIGRVQAMRSLTPMLAAERARVIVVVDGRDNEQSVQAVSPGTVVRVRPGERLPVDGVVIEGCSECDEAVLTGQSEPQAKGPGIQVYAGSVNGTGELLIRTTQAGAATRWGQIGRLVREALGRKGLAGVFVDRVAAVFVPAVLVLAAGTVLFWSGQGSIDQALMAGLAVLVVACPCALGLAAPLATAIGLGQAAQRGILIRGGGVFERLARIQGVAFDKTGTLTTGEMRLQGIVKHGIAEEELLRVAAALARCSDHPVACGISTVARVRGLALPDARDLKLRPGEGVVGEIGGVSAAMGSAALMKALCWSDPTDIMTGSSAGPKGCSSVYVGWGRTIHGQLFLSDDPAPEARSVVAALGQMGLETRLLSGDTPAAVAWIAGIVGIENWQGSLSPTDKVDALRNWARRQGSVAMVGDGMNDGPVLAAASVGIAVGTATDLARESADIVLPAHALARLPWTVELARRVRKTIATNITWALGYNLAALALAAAGLLQPIAAAGLMAGSSLLVTINSLRLRRERLGHSPTASNEIGVISPVAADGERIERERAAPRAVRIGS
jgi:Cu2+-exporting ATPase